MNVKPYAIKIVNRAQQTKLLRMDGRNAVDCLNRLLDDESVEEILSIKSFDDVDSLELVSLTNPVSACAAW